MAINTNKARSMIEEMTDMPRRRSSIFERSSGTEDEGNVACLKLDEWDRRWGKDNADSMNEVLVYPRDYLQQIKEEKEMWKSCIYKVIDRFDLFQKNLENDMVEHYPLSEEQQERLLTIDSKIDKYLSNITSSLMNIELSHSQHQNHIRNIQLEMDLETKLVTATMNKTHLGS